MKIMLLYLLLVAVLNGGNLGLESDRDLTYNPSWKNNNNWNISAVININRVEYVTNVMKFSQVYSGNSSGLLFYIK